MITKFNESKKDYFILFSLFVTVFILPLFIFKIPIQLDDFWAFNEVNIIKLNITEFTEFKRSPIGGIVLYYLYKLSNLIVKSLTTNYIFIIFFLCHFFTSAYLYNVIKKIISLSNIKSEINMPLWGAAIFLLQQPAIECYGTIAYGARVLGGLCVVLFILNQINQLNEVKISRTLYSMLLSILAFSFYEVNIFFLGIAFILPTIIGIKKIATNKSKIAIFFLQWKQYYISLITSIAIAFVYFLITVTTLLSLKSENVAEPLLIQDVFKRFIYYIAQNVLPNIHGSIFLGSIIFLICLFSLLMLVIKKSRNFSSTIIKLIGGLVIISLGFKVILSLLPYFAPRLLYTYTIILAILITLCLNEIKSINIRTQKNNIILYSISYGIMIASIINILHFFVLQNG